MPKSQSNPHPLEAAAGWLLPGLGHFILGQRLRGIILMISIGGLWLSGLLIGGVTVIDSHKQMPGWFFGQMLMAPSIAVNYYHIHVLKPRGIPKPEDKPMPRYEPSLGRTQEQGTLFTALAGLLNLLAIVDVAYCDAEKRKRKPKSDA